MVRIFHVYYPVRTLFLVAGDAIGLFGSFVLAVFFQYGADAMLLLQYDFGFLKIGLLTGSMLVVAHYLDLYSPYELTSSIETYVRLYALFGGVTLFLALLVTIWPEVAIGNNVFLYGTVIAVAALSGWRSLYNLALSRNFLTECVYVLGDGQRAQRLVEVLGSRADIGMRVIGFSGTLTNATAPQLAEHISDAWHRHRIDRVIVALEDRRRRMPIDTLIEMRLKGVVIEEATELLEKITGRLEVNSLTTSSLIFTDGFHVSTTHQILMRIVSMTVALLMLVVLSPLLLLVGIAIRLDSPGPALFLQKRVGEQGKKFTLFKFRSMKLGSEGPAPVDRDDPRFTRVGKFLRRVRLDELPQMINVLKGDMNLVGPRPFVPVEEAECAEKIPFYSLRWHVKPGVTGWAQIRRGYNRTIEENTEKLAYDLFYIKNASVALDLLIMFDTAKIILLRRGSR